MTSPAVSPPPPAPVEVVQYDDYFGFEKTEVFTLPDGKQQIFFQVMNEGAKTKFQQKTNRGIHLNRATQDARIDTDPAGERRALIEESVTGWSLMKRRADGQGWEPAPFSKGSPGSELNKWLDKANPQIVEALEDAIRKANPWLLGDMTLEQIDQEMQRLADLRQEVEQRQAREATFS